MKESVLQNEARDLDQVTRHEQKLIEKIKANSASIQDDIKIARSESEFQLGNMEEKCTELRSVAEQLQNGLDENNGNDSELFITIIKAKYLLKSTTGELTEAKEQAKVRSYRFTKCVDHEKMFDFVKSFGCYEEDVKDVQPTQSAEQCEQLLLDACLPIDDTGKIGKC